MDKEKIISDISLYLDLFLETKHQSKAPDIPSLLPKTQMVRGVYVSKTVGINEELIKGIIKHCSDEVLDDLIVEYGEESVLGQIIRQKLAEDYIAKQQSSARDIQKSLEESVLCKNYSNPFYDMVCNQIDEKGYKSDSDFYNSIGMPRQLFARLRDPNACLSKKTVLWIIIGLKLNYNEAINMLSTAGYSFRKNEKKDVIISCILRKYEYDLSMVNEILDHFGESPFC